MRTEWIGPGSWIGGGTPRTILGTLPPGGTNWSETVPAGVRWRLIALAVDFTTDATVATRGLALEVTGDAGGNVSRTIAGVQVASSFIRRLFAATGANQSGFFITGPIPQDMILLPGWTFDAATSGLQPGDFFGAPTFMVEEWLI